MGNHAGPNSLVYVVRCGDTEFYKLGTTYNPPARIQTIQTGNPFEIVLMAVFTGGYPVEREMKKNLRNLRVRGEWYKIPGDALGLIERVILTCCQGARRVDPGSVQWDIRELQ